MRDLPADSTVGRPVTLMRKELRAVGGMRQRTGTSQEMGPSTTLHGKAMRCAYLPLCRRMSSATPNPARPVASNAKLTGSGTGAGGVLAWA
jgi:hypothetical protein